MTTTMERSHACHQYGGQLARLLHDPVLETLDGLKPDEKVFVLNGLLGGVIGMILAELGPDATEAMVGYISGDVLPEMVVALKIAGIKNPGPRTP